VAGGTGPYRGDRRFRAKATGERELRGARTRRRRAAGAGQAGQHRRAAREARSHPACPGGRRVTTRLATWMATGLVSTLAGCAQIEMPPGGPEDRMPPAVVSLQPDSLAVVPEWRRPVVVRFSERISEQQVEDAVMVSPRTSAVSVDRGSREIRVSLRRGWEPGQIYQITVRPLIRDLFNNQIREPIHLVFSTGPEIPPTRLT